MSSVQSYVKNLVAEALSMDEREIDEGQPLSHYGFSSIDMIDIIVKLEEKYHVAFEPDKMKNLTCRLLAENVESRIAAR